MDALDRIQDRRADEEAEEGVGEDVEEGAHRETRNESPGRDTEDATCDDRRHAQTRGQPSRDDRRGAVMGQPTLGLVEAGWREVNVAPVAVDEIATSAGSDDI